MKSPAKLAGIPVLDSMLPQVCGFSLRSPGYLNLQTARDKPIVIWPKGLRQGLEKLQVERVLTVGEH